MNQRKASLVTGEYRRVSERVQNPELLESLYFTPIQEAEVEMLVKKLAPNTDVLFYPDIRATAVDSQGSTYIRLPNNPLTEEDIRLRINYPRLTLGVVIHELAHIRAGLYYAHGWQFVQAMDELIELLKDDKWKQVVSEEIEKQANERKIAKSIGEIMKLSCPTCGKKAESIVKFEDESHVYHQLKCGHLLTQEKTLKELSPLESFQSIRGEKLYPFQRDNVKKFEEANGRLCIFDEMGLGKTPCSIAIKHIYEFKKTLILCKAGLRHQMKAMTEYWGNEVDDLGLSHIQTQVIENPKDSCLAGQDFYIVSYDLLANLKPDFFKFQKLPNGKLIPLQIDYCIIDECQHIKNPEAQRTRAVFEICKDIPNIVFLSGTPIKNNAAEFYPVLHMIDPARFSSKARFCSEFVDSYMKGPYIKYGGIRDYTRFKRVTDRFMIRHTQAEVLPELPEITRNFVYTELSKSQSSEYAKLAKEFRDYYYKAGKEDREFFQNILQFFTRMRHLTGLAKVDEAVDFAIEFLESTDRKLAIFTHHIDVREEIVKKLNAYLKEKESAACLELVGSMDGNKKEELKEKFNFKPEYRILVASTLASGEGHNLQHACSDCLMLERQWNPSNEEQAEFRFKRPGQQASVISATYLVAIKTIDEYFTKLVENKRIDVKYSLDGTAKNWNENQILQDLARILATQE